MKTSDRLVIALFVGAVVIVFAAAALMSVHALLGRLVWRAPPAQGAYLWIRRVVLALAGIGILCLVYACFVEPYWLDVTRVRLASPGLPAGRRPIRVVQLSDLHSEQKERLEEKLPGLIASLEPDVIVFTGDAINSPGGLLHFKRCLTRLAKLAPTFVVKGNWDVYHFGETDLFGQTGAVELNGEAAKVEVAGAEIWIAGVAVGDEAKITEALNAVPPEAFGVFLYHYPDELPEAARRKVDIHCAGHTHGGQVALPFYGALVTLSKHGKRYEAGLYRLGRMHLYVNRGIGMEGAPAPRLRFFARPEVTVFEIAGAQ